MAGFCSRCGVPVPDDLEGHLECRECGNPLLAPNTPPPRSRPGREELPMSPIVRGFYILAGAGLGVAGLALPLVARGSAMAWLSVLLVLLGSAALWMARLRQATMAIAAVAGIALLLRQTWVPGGLLLLTAIGVLLVVQRR